MVPVLSPQEPAEPNVRTDKHEPNSPEQVKTLRLLVHPAAALGFVPEPEASRVELLLLSAGLFVFLTFYFEKYFLLHDLTVTPAARSHDPVSEGFGSQSEPRPRLNSSGWKTFGSGPDDKTSLSPEPARSSQEDITGSVTGPAVLKVLLQARFWKNPELV